MTRTYQKIYDLRNSHDREISHGSYNDTLNIHNTILEVWNRLFIETIIETGELHNGSAG
jgi:hypothetical protein